MASSSTNVRVWYSDPFKHWKVEGKFWESEIQRYGFPNLRTPSCLLSHDNDPVAAGTSDVTLLLGKGLIAAVSGVPNSLCPPVGKFPPLAYKA